MIPANAAPAERWHADVLVVGAGVAGLSAALAAAPRRVLILCPDEPTCASSSALAQGGIAAPLGPEDSVESHVGDTLEAACHSADIEAVSCVIGRAADAIAFLEASGVEFDRIGIRRSLHLEAGHRHARVAHAAGDRSGEIIVGALWARVCAAPHVDVLSGWRAVALLGASRAGVIGARVADAYGRIAIVHARATVLATGGIGRLYRHTTNGEYATGDGLAMALAIGARTAALEFVQFHPTALRVQADPLPLLTEALRGAGARLVTARGAPIMAGRHILGDLAPRDIVARTVWEHAQAGEDVLLDATAVFGSDKGSAFPGARRTALSHGIDPAVAPLPVTAAAHYHMGGVVVDASGRTSLPGLWACGEVAYTGLHGANRLASNSLLEAVVCGQAVGAAIATESSRPCPVAALDAAQVSPAADRDERWTHIRDRMWRAMGPVRDAGTLHAALTATLIECEGLGPEDGLLRQRFDLVAAMLAAATAREESRGAHWRSDFPRRDARRDGPRAVYPCSPEPAAANITDTHGRGSLRVHPID
jgi:L-aspartate oxidase